MTSLGYSAIEVVDAMREQASTLPYLHAMRFEALPAQLPVVGDVRSMGLMGGVEPVADTDTGQPFPASTGIAARATRLALDEGVIVYPCSGGVDGEAGDYLILAPPCVTSEDDLEQMVLRTGRALRRLDQECAAAQNAH